MHEPELLNTLPNNAADDHERQLLLNGLPGTPTRYFSDNLRILLESKFEGDTYAGAPIRFSGNEMKLLYEIHAWLRRDAEVKQRGGTLGGRPRDANPSKAALAMRKRRFAVIAAKYRE